MQPIPGTLQRRYFLVGEEVLKVRVKFLCLSESVILCHVGYMCYIFVSTTLVIITLLIFDYTFKNYFHDTSMLRDNQGSLQWKKLKEGISMTF